MQMLRYIIMVLLATSAIALILFGPRTNVNIPPNRIVVEYWEKWTGNEELKMRSVIKEFNDTVGAQKGIYVRYLSMANVQQKTLIATAAGAPPDIAGMYDWNMVQYASLDAIMPLDDMAAQYGINEKTYKKVYWDAVHYNRRLWCLISTPASVGLLYNRKIFEENADALRKAGLDPMRPPETIDELDKYAVVLDQRDARGHITRAGTLPLEPGWYLYHLPFWFGSNIWDEQHKRFNLDDPKIVKVFEWIQSYSRRLGKDATQEFFGSLGTFDSPQNAFMHGNVVMEMNGPWMANYIFNNNPKMSSPRITMTREQEMKLTVDERRKLYDWAVAPWPSDDPTQKDVSYCTSDVLVIPKGAKHPKEAFEFIAWLTRQENMEKLCKLHCKNSPLEQVSEDFLHNHDNPYIDVFERLARSPNAHFAARIPVYQEARDALTVAIQRVALMQNDPDTGKPITPEKALTQLQQKLQSRYEDYMEKQKSRKTTTGN